MEERLNTIIQKAELIIIKRDFDLLKKLILTLPPEVQAQLLPYTALFCHEVIAYMNKMGAEIEIEETSVYSIKDVRQKTKFFDLSLNKLFQSIENIDNIQNKYFIDLMRYPELGEWNIHDNLGIYFDAEGNIVSNTHYTYYVFQDDKRISQSSDKPEGIDLAEQEIKAFAYDLGKIIGSISSGMNQLSDFISADVSPLNVKLYSQDYNTNSCLRNENSKYKTIRLFLLHVISSIGLILFVLRKKIIRDTGLMVRFEYITFHYALLRLEKLKNYCNENQKVINDMHLVDMLNKIDYHNKDGLRKVEFRNCMMHFGLTNEDGVSLIAPDKFDASIPMCGLVESFFDVCYNEYKARIEDQLMNLYQMLSEYLSFEFIFE